ncbi:MAG: PAS domain S-box protein, partial [Chloroflexota bacterium]|nr:PAS domain S-box protein [Chloroflexota bacterium]
MPDDLRLLLIDDDEDSYVLVRDFVAETTSAWTVSWAPTYERGLAELASGGYDAALLDFHLGARTGVELLAAVRDMENLPPIVLLTGQGDRAIDLAAMATGAADYLDKGSLSPIVLERTVRHALERDRTLAALRASEARYHGLFERAADAVLIADDDGCYVDANAAACVLFGVPRDRLIGHSLAEFVVGGADVPDPEAAWSAFLAAGEMSGQVRIQRPDGSVRDAGSRATANFTPGRHLSVVRDETERTAAAAALADSETRFRSSIESMLDPFAILTAIRDAAGMIVDFELTFVNEPLARLFGWTSEPARGGALLTRLPAHASNGLFNAYCAVVESGQPYVHDELIYEDDLESGSHVRLALDLRVVRLGDGVALTGREISAYLASQAALADSEERFRLLAERSRDVIFKFRSSPDFAFEYISPSITDLVGYTPAELVDDAELGKSLIHPDDWPELAARIDDGSFFAEPAVIRWIRTDGSVLWMEHVTTEILDATGQRVSIEGVARDVTARILAREALVASERRFRNALDGIALHSLILDPEGRIEFANHYHLAATGWSEEDLIGSDAFVWLADEDDPDARRARYMRDTAAGATMDRIETTWLTRSGEGILIAWTSSPILDEDGRLVAVSSVGEDVTARREAEAAQSRLIGAIDQAAETIIVTDAAARVVYANPAFAASSGYGVADLVGRNLWVFLREAGSTVIHRRLARRLRSGRSWSGEWSLRRPDGVAYREEVTISPVRDVNGTISSFVCVGRDVSQVRQIQASLDLVTRDRVAFAHALTRLEQRPTPEETGQDLTDALAELAGVDVAMVLSFDEPEVVRILASTAPGGYPLQTGDALPAGRAAYLRERAAGSAWSEPFIERDEDGAYGEALGRFGLRAIAAASVAGPNGPIGLVAIGTTDEAAARRWSEQVPAVIEFAAAARGLIGGPLAARSRLRESADEIRRIVAAGEFEPVFQPIVHLETGAAIGYEALTRFGDGRRPDLVFEAAGACGLGLALEAATLDRAIEASYGLPVGPWLALNVSAAMVLDGDRLGRILRRRTRPIVLELTEHDVIGDYGKVRNAIALLGPDVRTAVDDAGAGVANFTHIVELRPDFVKIDAGLVHGVNSDLTRQALIVGLHHFARATNGWVIAEGVETEEERQTLMSLDVKLAQGYLLGQPAGAEAWPSPAPRPRVA